MKRLLLCIVAMLFITACQTPEQQAALRELQETNAALVEQLGDQVEMLEMQRDEAATEEIAAEIDGQIEDAEEALRVAEEAKRVFEASETPDGTLDPAKGGLAVLAGTLGPPWNLVIPAIAGLGALVTGRKNGASQ